MVVYEQLQTDCAKLKCVKVEGELEGIINQIVKDQLGLEKCIEKLWEVTKKYQYTMQLAMAVSNVDMEFNDKMLRGIDHLISNAKIL